jgi:hypothetical protein
MADVRDDETITAAYPGAVTIANGLRTVGWFIIGIEALLGLVVGIAVGAQGGGGGAAAGALIGGLAGACAGAASAVGAFALAYVLLLLTQIEANTRISAVG